jgi:pilus assembly protein Flp/PilA
MTAPEDEPIGPAVSVSRPTCQPAPGIFLAVRPMASRDYVTHRVKCRRYESLEHEAASLTDQQGVAMLKLYVSVQNFLALRRDDRGATAVEYGLMVGLIAAVIVTIVTTLGGDVKTEFSNVANAL